MARWPATVVLYQRNPRRCEVSIPGVSDGGTLLAEIEQNLGDRSPETEIRIKAGDLVWVDFISGDPRYPIITGFRARNVENMIGTRHWEHENFTMVADETVLITAGQSVRIEAGALIELVLSAHWSKRDALGAISKYKAGKAVNFNYREKLVGEPFLVTAPEEGVSPAPTPDPAPAPTPDPAPALAPEPDPAQVEALALLQSVIDGTASMDAALADRLLAAHEKFAGGAEFDPLFEQASQAYADAMVAKARTALAA